MLVCGDCGVSGDGKAGWLEDHWNVCAEREVACPCKIYGCEERMPRRRVGAHLAECPACGVYCCFSKNDEHTLRCIDQAWHNQLLKERPHVRVDWDRGGGIVADEHSCRGIIRRTDMDAHHRFAHAEIDAIFQKCAYCVPTDSQERNPKTDGYVEAPPASPLHPPPGTRYTAPHQTGDSWRPWIPNGVQFYPGGQLGEISRKKGWRDDKPVNSGGNNPSGCQYLRQILAPVFSGGAPPAAGAQRAEGDAFCTLTQTADVLLPLLLGLPPNTLRVLACVNRALRDAVGDQALFTRRHLIRLRWERRRDLPEQPAESAWWRPTSRWEATVEWVKPELPTLTSGWKRVNGPCIGEHMRTCSHRAPSEFEKLGIAPTDAEEEERSRCATPEPQWELLSAEELEAHMFRAVMAENLLLLDTLFKNGANIHATNAGGYSALGLATERGKKVSCSWLARHGGVVVKPL